MCQSAKILFERHLAKKIASKYIKFNTGSTSEEVKNSLFLREVRN
jgi:hypothetical protein